VLYYVCSIFMGNFTQSYEKMIITVCPSNQTL
jgi:hypothetical protein